MKKQENLDEKRLLKCLLHQYILDHQKKAYLSDKDELKKKKLGARLLGQSYANAALVVTDYTLLSPSTSRHQDMIFHVYQADNFGGLKSSVHHFVGEHDQKNNASFSIDGLKQFVKVEPLKSCDLIVFFSDGGPKHYKLGVIMDCVVEIEKETGKKIVWNFFASNHGGGAADGDGQTAQRQLAYHVKHNSEILNNMTDKIVSLINKIKSHYATNAKDFRKYTDLSQHEMKGIKKKHCFIVKDGHAVGFSNSMSLSDPTVYTYTPIDHPEWYVHPAPVAGSRTQEALKIRAITDSSVKRCDKCDYYYMKVHKKCHTNKEKKRASDSESEESSEESMVEIEDEDKNDVPNADQEISREKTKLNEGEVNSDATLNLSKNNNENRVSYEDDHNSKRKRVHQEKSKSQKRRKKVSDEEREKQEEGEEREAGEEQEKQELVYAEVPLGSNVRVWFQDKKKYYKGTVSEYNDKMGYKVQYRNHTFDYVHLQSRDNTLDALNSDRWNYI
jgi:hypothetical protein